MSEALDAHVSFDDAPRGQAPSDGAAARIAEALKERMADAPDALYNESLTLARDGHLGQAASRLQMLLCLDPDDADALLLLAKVHAAQGRPSEALAKLDAALAAGLLPPIGFREQLEHAIRADRVREEESRARVASREKGEVSALRQEARSLRSDAIRLETEVTETRRREGFWKTATVGASLFGTFVILAITLIYRSPPPAAPPRAAGAPPAMDLSLDASPGTAERTDGPAAPGSRLAGRASAVPAAVTSRVERQPAAPESAASSAAPVAAVKPVAEAAPTPAKAAGPQTHVVASGDTLRKIAKRYYGDASKADLIEKANKVSPTNLKLGQELTIPPAK